MTTPSFDLLGIRLHAMTKHDITRAAAQAVERDTQYIIANHNLHSVYLWYRNLRIREFYALADYTHIDGMPLVLVARLLGLPLKSQHRNQYFDLLPMLFNEATRCQWRIFYLGSRPGVAEKGFSILRTQYPGLQVATHHGHFDTNRSGKDNLNVLAEIREFAPDILMVGMGMPRQEIWVLENRQDIAAHAIFCCGGLMDLVAGEIPTAPRWLGPLCLEWLYRLLSEPTRLWRRYLLEPWFIFFQVSKRYLQGGHLPVGMDSTTHERRR